MTVKNLGRTKKYKHIKCSVCGCRIELIDEDIEHVNNVKFIICPRCGNENLIKNK